MTFWKCFFFRELKLAATEGGGWSYSAIQTFLCGILFPFALPASPSLLAQLGSGIIWACALMGCLIPIDGLFAQDLQDGSLENLLCRKIPLSFSALLKIIAVWSVRALPTLFSCAILAVFFHYPFEKFPLLLLSLAVGTLLFCLIGGMVSAFMPAGRKGNPMLGLIFLPLCIPIMIFGAFATSTAEKNIFPPQNAFEILLALLFLALPLCAIACGTALKEQISQM